MATVENKTSGSALIGEESVRHDVEVSDSSMNLSASLKAVRQLRSKGKIQEARVELAIYISLVSNTECLDSIAEGHAERALLKKDEAKVDQRRANQLISDAIQIFLSVLKTLEGSGCDKSRARHLYHLADAQLQLSRSVSMDESFQLLSDAQDNCQLAMDINHRLDRWRGLRLSQNLMNRIIGEIG